MKTFIHTAGVLAAFLLYTADRIRGFPRPAALARWDRRIDAVLCDGEESPETRARGQS
jgi:hypothetical protein